MGVKIGICRCVSNNIFPPASDRIFPQLKKLLISDCESISKEICVHKIPKNIEQIDIINCGLEDEEFCFYYPPKEKRKKNQLE